MLGMEDKTITGYTISHEKLVETTPGLIADDDVRLQALATKVWNTICADLIRQLSPPLAEPTTFRWPPQAAERRCKCRGVICLCGP